MNRNLGNPDAVQDFNMLWISEFKKTNAYEVWERVTDSMLFDIVEPRYVNVSSRANVITQNRRILDTHVASGHRW